MARDEHITGLTSRYFLWLSGFISLQELLEDIRLFAYTYGQRRLNISEDDNSGFFLAMYGEWERLIRNFQYKGIPLEHFVSRVLKQRIRGYLRDERRNQHRELAIVNYRGFYEQVHEEALNWDECEDEEDIIEANSLLYQTLKLPYFAKRKKAAFVYCLRNYIDIDPLLVKEFAELCGVPEARFKACVQRVDAALGAQASRREQMQLLHDRQLLQLFSLQKRQQQSLIYESEERLKELICKKQRAIANTEKRIEALRLQPSHRLIAQIIGVPSGTVSSILIQIQKYLGVLAGDRDPA